MHHFFVKQEQIQENEIIIRGKDVNHIRSVLRMQVGEELSVSNGEDDREYRCGIERIEEDAVICSLRFIKEDGVELPSRICLFQGLPKADKMEFIIQKAVELGVGEIVPFSCKRAVVRLDEKKAGQKQVRWQSVSEAAAKQCRRAQVPTVHTPVSFQEALKLGEELDLLLIPYELAQGMEKTREVMTGIEPGKSIGVFIGPEGGFDEKEIQAAKERGAVPITLGRRILRTETAGLTVLSWLMYHLEGKA